jgi:hypothetical protein
MKLKSPNYRRPFVMLLNGERMYGGIFLDAPSQMAIAFPVARCAVEGKRCVIHFLPVQLSFFNTDPAADAKAGGDHPADVPSEMMDHFRKSAIEPEAVENRKLLQDSRIHSWLSTAGKLR